MRIGVALAMAAAMSIQAPSRATATSTTTGSGVFDLTLTITTFPCNINPPCQYDGTVSGSAVLSLSGLSNSSLSAAPLPYSATWASPQATLSGDIRWASDSCAFFTQLPVQGTDAGHFALSGGVLVVGGATLDNATLTGAYLLSRIGTAVQLELQSLTITASSNGSTVATNLGNAISGAGVMGEVFTNLSAVCGNSQQQIAMVPGIAVQPV